MSYSDAELERTQTLVSQLFRLERVKTVEEMRHLIGQLADWLKSPAQSGICRAFTVWLGRFLIPRKCLAQNVPEFHDLQEVNTMLAETVKSWTDQWLAEGKVISIHTVLTARFKDVPPEVLERIKAHKDLEILKQLTARAATADSLDAFSRYLFALPLPDPTPEAEEE